MSNFTCLKASKRARHALLALLILSGTSPALLAGGHGPGQAAGADSGPTSSAAPAESSKPRSSWSLSQLPSFWTVLKRAALFLALATDPAMPAASDAGAGPKFAPGGDPGDSVGDIADSLTRWNQDRSQRLQYLEAFTSQPGAVQDRDREIVTHGLQYLRRRMQLLDDLVSEVKAGRDQELTLPALFGRQARLDHRLQNFLDAQEPIWSMPHRNADELRTAFHNSIAPAGQEDPLPEPRYLEDLTGGLFGCWERMEHPLSGQRTLYQVTPEGVHSVRITRDGRIHRTCIPGQVTALLEYPADGPREGWPGPPARATLSIEAPGGKVSLPFLLFQVEMGGTDRPILMEQGGDEHAYIKASWPQEQAK